YVCLALNALFTLAVPMLLGTAVDAGLGQSDLGAVAQMSVALLGVSLLRGLAAFGQGYLAEASAQGVSYSLRRALYAQVQRLSFSFHDQAQTGELMARATADVESVRNFTGRGLLQIVNMFLLLIGVALVLLRMNGELVAFYAYLLQLVQPIRRGGWLMTMASRASASSERIFEILDTPVTVADRPGAVAVPALVGRVEFQDVSCSYYPGRPVLHHIS